LRISPRALDRRSPGYLPAVVTLDAVCDPGGTVGTRLLRAFRIACTRHDGLGSLPKFTFLGAMCQIQSDTLHLVSHAYLPVRLAPSGHYTSERLTKPYSGELPACAVPSQLANIARLPMPKGPRGQPTPQPRGHCSNCEKPSPRTIATVFSSMTAMAYFRPSSTDPLNTWNCLYLKHHPEVPRLTASVNGSSVHCAEAKAA
jgi:hypothetical protein